MRSTTLQLCAWWPPTQPSNALLSLLEQILRSFSFSIHPDLQTNSRRHGNFFGWDRVALPTEMRQVWFAFCPSTEGPWIALKLQCRKKGTVPQFESLFREVIEQLQPIECVLCNTNVDTLPCLAHSSYRGGITAIVNCNVEPPVELRPGQPGWFEALGIELRYFSGHLLDQHAIDPAVRASQFAQTFMPVGDGFVFDGGWGNHWQKVLSPTPGRNRPRPAASLRRLVNR